jgi:hypothetical protein
VTAPVDHFRNQADDCKRLAGRALKPVDKAFWLRLAAYWLELGEKGRRNGQTDGCQSQQS